MEGEDYMNQSNVWAKLTLDKMRTLHGNLLLFAEDNRLLTDTTEEVRGNNEKGKKEHSRLRQHVSWTPSYIQYTTLHLLQVKIPCKYDWTDESSLTVH